MDYQLEKSVWTEEDFDLMGWHDSRVYALAFSPETSEFMLDIDYIFAWVEPLESESEYSFWVSPTTLVFEHIYDLRIDIGAYLGELQIQDIRRAEPVTPRNAAYSGKNQQWLWTIECLEGQITFQSTGYKQYIRKKPILGAQGLEASLRGISFERYEKR